MAWLFLKSGFDGRELLPSMRESVSIAASHRAKSAFRFDLRFVLCAQHARTRASQTTACQLYLLPYANNEWHLHADDFA